MKKFDPTKPVQTRDGKPARILASDLRNPAYPIVAAIYQLDQEVAFTYAKNGRYLDSVVKDEMDLINIPEKHVRWLNVYPTGLGRLYLSREEADRFSSPNRIACIRIEYEEGEGLE